MFGVTVPRTSALEEAALTGERALSESAYGGMEDARILLIENDLSSAEGLASLLEKWGCDVAIAASAAKGLDTIRAPAELPYVIIADLHLDNGEAGIKAV